MMAKSSVPPHPLRLGTNTEFQDLTARGQTQRQAVKLADALWAVSRMALLAPHSARGREAITFSRAARRAVYNKQALRRSMTHDAGGGRARPHHLVIVHRIVRIGSLASGRRRNSAACHASP